MEKPYFTIEYRPLKILLLMAVGEWQTFEVGRLEWKPGARGPTVLCINVVGKYRGNGYARAMLGVLEALKGKAIPDYLTPSGKTWWESMGRDSEPYLEAKPE